MTASTSARSYDVPPQLSPDVQSSHEANEEGIWFVTGPSDRLWF